MKKMNAKKKSGALEDPARKTINAFVIQEQQAAKKNPAPNSVEKAR